MFSPLIVELVGVHQYTLSAPLIYEDEQFKITAHIGFISDGASTPEILYSVIGCPFGELYTKAAIMHDLFYRAGIFSRKMSDYLFLKMMLEEGVPRAKSRAMYLGVRAGGESSYLGMGSPAKFREFISVELKN